MKRLFFFLIISLFFLFPSFDSFATSYTPLNTAMDVMVPDDSGEPYHFHHQYCPQNSERTYTFDGYFVLSDDNARIIAIYDGTTEPERQIRYCSRLNPFNGNLEDIVNEVSFSATYDYSVDLATLNYNSEFKANSSPVFWSINSCELYNDFSTNIPIYDLNSDTFFDDANKYITTGDMSKSLNYDLISPDFGGGAQPSDDSLEDAEFDESVEKPLNGRTYGDVTKAVNYKLAHTGRAGAGVSWDITQKALDDNYTYDVQLKAFYFKSYESSKIIETGWKNLYSNYPYDTGDTVDLKTGNTVKRTPATPERISFDYSIIKEVTGSDYMYPVNLWTEITKGELLTSADIVKCVRVRVRNRCGSKCSNWMVINFYTNDGKANVSMEDDSGDYVPDEDYQGQDVNTDHTDIDYETDYDPSKDPDFVLDKGTGLQQLYSFIKSGFNINGSDGLIALFVSFFSYFPPAMGSALLVGTSLMVTIGLIKLVLKG